MDKKLAFVRGGGGSRGALQVGALYALGESGLQPDLLVGTSVGAVNAAFLAVRGLSKESMDDLASMWRATAALDLIPANYVWLTVRAMFRRPSDDPAGRIRDYFLSHGVTPEMRFSDVKYSRLVIVSADLNTGKPVLHGERPDDNLLEALMASTALPPWFSPIVKHDRYLMDGGAVSNLPIEAALTLGATDIVALDLMDARDMPLSHGQGLVAFLEKLILGVQKRQTDLELELAHARGVAMTYLNLTGEPHVPLWDFHHSKELISHGYALARRALDGQETVEMSSAEAVLAAEPVLEPD